MNLEQQNTQKLRLLVAIPGMNYVDILVVDDGSTDDTSLEAQAAGATVLRHQRNQGVGSAFQSALNYAIEHGYDLMVNIDGDRQFNPRDIPKLVTPMIEGNADMVTASRFVDSTYTPSMPKVKLLGNHMMSYLISTLVRQKFADVSCGFRCYSRESLLRLNLNGAFTYTQETFLDFAVKCMEIKEVPIEVVYFADRKSRVAGSIAKYAINTATIIFRSYRDYFPLRFFWSIAAIFAVPAAFLAVVFFVHYLHSGTFTGFLFAGFGSAFMFVMSAVFFVLGIVTDMLDRIRTNQERILYLLKKQQ